MRDATRLESQDGLVTLSIAEIGEVTANASVLAPGVTYRRVGIPALEELVGAGVFYGASVSEAHHLAGEHAFVVGGGNSAGQAVMHLSRYARQVAVLVCGTALDRMSQYLKDELEATQNVDVRLGTEVVGGGGGGRLERLVLLDCEAGVNEEVDAGGLFLMIGGVPLTEWLPEEIERDRGGYLLTGSDLVQDGRVVECWPLDRPPQALETSMNRVFAAGDARHGSSNRVASAVGDGSVVIAQIHRLIDDPRPRPRLV